VEGREVVAGGDAGRPEHRCGHRDRSLHRCCDPGIAGQHRRNTSSRWWAARC